MEIVITDRMVERAVYWVIIIALLVLLVFTYLGKGTGNGGTAAASAAAPETAAANTTANETAQPAQAAAPAPAASCSDGEKNQDETDVDCGGSICRACATGKACATNADCSQGACLNGKCAALSGTVSLSLKNVAYTGGVSVAAKVTGITVSVKNGKTTPLSLRLDVYAKTSDELYYLNQLGSGSEDTGGTPYASIALPTLQPGASLDKTYTKDDLKGTYLFSSTGKYGAGDDFSVEIQLIDRATGDVVQTATKAVTV